MTLIQKKEDRKTLCFIGVMLIQNVVLLVLPFSILNLLFIFLALLTSSLIVFTSCVVNHNHQHHSIFVNASANRFIDFIISFLISAPASRLHQVHLHNHHKHFRGQKDWTCFETTAKGQGFFRLMSYLFKAGTNVRKNRNLLKDCDPQLHSNIEQERIFVYLSIVICLLINPISFVLILIPARIFGMTLLFLSNLINHDHCDLTSNYNHSRDFLNSFENWLFFNSGYHTAHHLSPSTHWSNLPVLHKEKIAKFKNKDFVGRTFFGYIALMILRSSASQES